MPQQLLAASLEHAERSDPVVRAAALLHIARVLNAFDHSEAERVLERGLALAEALPEPEREVIMGQGVSLAATVSPTRALDLAPSLGQQMPGRGPLGKALSDMIRHGHVAEAIQYLSEPRSLDDYPFDAALQAMARAKDDTPRLQILRGAVRAMRHQAGSGRPGRRFSGGLGFPALFTRWWRLLPVEEGTEVVRELVHGILAEPEGSINGTIQDVTFSSTHAHQLFQILAPLRRLDPLLAESLIRDHPQLADAATRYPFGKDSIEEALHARTAREPVQVPVSQPDYISVGRRLIPIPEALANGFQEAFDLALRLYARERDPEHPNDGPQEVWPSAQEFRNILYKAGRHEGRIAVRHLERVPDPALRLFAQIELAAALAGLPQMGGTSISPGPDGFRQSMTMRARARERGPLNMRPAPRSPRPPLRKPNVPPSDEARIAPTYRTREDGPAGGCGPDYWVMEGAPLRPVLAMLYDMPGTRIDLPASLENGRFDFVLVLPRPDTRETMIRLMREGLEQHFHVTRERRSMEVDVLTAPNGITAHDAHEDDARFGAGSVGFVEAAPDGSPGIPDEIAVMEMLNLRMVPSAHRIAPEEAMREMQTQFLRTAFGSRRAGVGINSLGLSLTMGQLCQILESGLDRPMLDETNLTGTYAINVHAEAFSTREFLHVLYVKLGLVVAPARRDVSILVVQAR